MTDTGSLYRRARELARMATSFARLDAIHDISYPMNTALRYFSAVFPVFIYFFIARLLPERAADSIGSDYFTFSAVGLAAAGVLQMALTGLGSRLQRYQDQGVLETLLVEPVPWTFVPIAMNTWPALRATLAGSLALGISVLLGARLSVDGLGLAVLVLGFGMVAAFAIGIVSASVLVLSKRADPVMQVYGLAASLLGGAVFPIELLPGWLRIFSYLIPHTYVISATRSALMVDPPDVATSVPMALTALGVFDVVVMVGGVYLFGRSLEYARSTGLLGAY